MFNENIVKFEIDGIRMLGNCSTSAVIGLDDDGEEIINNIINKRSIQIDRSEKSEKLIEALNRNGFFYKSDEDKYSIKSAYVHVTDSCNLHCIGCYSYVEERNKKTDLSFSQICDLFNQLKERNLEKVVISGGEPFNRPDFPELCRYIKGLGIDVFVITNGTKDIEIYNKAIPYIDEISVSVDGYDEETFFIRDKGIMPKVIKTIEYLKDKLTTKMIVTLHKKNISYMENYFELSKRLDIPFSFSILTTNPYNHDFKDYILDNNDYEVMKKYLKKQRNVNIDDTPINSVGIGCKNRCGAGRYLISVGADGNVYPCHMLHNDELKLGNILENNIKDIIFSKENPFLNISVDKIDECKCCKYKYLCGGSCRARSYLENGSIYKTDSLCKVSYSHISDKIDELKRMYNL